MKKLFIGLLMVCGLGANAQFTKASLQASGLTCSMCSKAVKNALEKVPFVDAVGVDIKNQEYNLTFRPGANVDFDALGRAVEDAGFSVARLRVSAVLDGVQLQKDKHVAISGQTFHFLNSSGQRLNGNVTFSLVDKSFVSSKDFKKYASMTSMSCVQTGQMTNSGNTEPSRIYHAII